MLTTHAQPPGVATAALAAARAIAPRGIEIRPWRDRADYDAMVEVFHAARAVDGSSWEITAESLDADIRAFGFEPEASILLAQQAGRVVGWARAWDFGFAPDDGRLLTHVGHVVPTARRRGIGRSLLAGAQASLLAVRAARSDPPGSTAGLHAWISATNASAMAMLEGAAYRRHRYYIEMTRTLDDVPAVGLPAGGLPAGLTTRPVTVADIDAVLRSLDEAMRDHRGWPALTPAQLRDMFDHPTRGQLDVWQVAWAGDRVVGGVLGYIDAAENAAMQRRRGYTEGIFTVRDWRCRGVAGALIAQNLRVLRSRGMTEAALSVDTENPSGALALYERHGFREDSRLIVFRSDLPPAS